MEFVSRQPIYFDMLDSLHMVHNAAYLLLFERARMDMAQTLSRRYGEDVIEWPCGIVRNEINYRVPITEMQEVRVAVSVEGIGDTSITFVQRVDLADGTCAADGKTVIVRIDSETHQAARWSDRFRERLKPYLADEW